MSSGQSHVVDPQPTLLSPSTYDEDAASLRSASDQDSDSEDDEVLQGARNTLEIAEHDRRVLAEEDDREKLLTTTSPVDGLRRIFGSNQDNGSSVKIGKKERRRQRRQERRAARRKRRGRNDEEGELMFEMEEGFKDYSSSNASTVSFESDRRRSDGVYQKQTLRSHCRKLAPIHAAIVVLFLILLLAAYKVSTRKRDAHRGLLLSNGTSLFAPTTILISLDGFRADFLNRDLTPTLNSLIAEGVSPRYMLPSFPSVTFPNHFTLITGLYPESHGIVGNTFWDPDLHEEFYYTKSSSSMQPKWWTAEPLWVTAENQGVRSAIHMWPGSEAHIPPVEPTYMDKFNETEALPRKVDRVLGLLDLPGDDDMDVTSLDRRPQFIAAYVPNVDADGHLYGPNSTEIRSTISGVDDMLRDIFGGLRERNLTEIVNVVIVSDHGMATTSTDRLLQLDDLIAISLVDHIDGWPLRGLRPKRPEDLQTLYDQALESSKKYDNKFDVYLKDRNMPERYHFSNNDRIAPLWIVPKTGWAVVERANFDVEVAKEEGKIYHPKGLHGYDHEHPLMRAIFVAKGPSFPHKPNSRVEVFQNTEVYNIVCDSLSIKPHPNNGTLRLPLKTIGLHSDEEAPPLDTPHDPPTEATNPTITEDRPSTTSNRGSVTEVSENGSNDKNDDDSDEIDSWWSYVIAKIEAAKAWTHGIISADEKNHPDPYTDEKM